MRYTKSQLETLLQFIEEKDIDQIETMAYGTWTTLADAELTRLYETYKVVWLHDEPYEIQLIPKDLLIAE
jgi:hypothetical protein